MYRIITLVSIFMLIVSCNNTNYDSRSDENEVSDEENYYSEEYSENETSTQGAGRVQCPNCEGSGVLQCNSCEGRGKKHCRSCDGDGWDRNDNRCLNCDGTGIITCNPEVTCSACQGYGHGYLVACPRCDGSTKKEDGTNCLCLNPIYQWGTEAGFDIDEDGIVEQGVFTQKYPGYLFNSHNP